MPPPVEFLLLFLLVVAVAYALALGVTAAIRHLIGHHVFPLITHPRVRDGWARLERLWPGAHRMLSARITMRKFVGLPLTLMLIGIAYGSALLAELAEEVAEEQEVVGFDTVVSDAVAPYRVPILVTIFKGITVLGSAVAVWIAGGAVMLRFWRTNRALILPLVVTIAGAQLTTWLTKHVLDRPRPEFVLDIFEESPSFPSGHTTAAIATYGLIAYLLARRAQRWRVQFEIVFWFGVLIALVGFSRVFLGVHFASDVVGGLLVGSIWLLVGAALVEWRERAAAGA